MIKPIQRKTQPVIRRKEPVGIPLPRDETPPSPPDDANDRVRLTCDIKKRSLHSLRILAVTEGKKIYETIEELIDIAAAKQ